MKVWKETGYLHSLKVSLPKSLWVTERNTGWLVEKSNRFHLKKVTNNSNRTDVSYISKYEASKSIQYHFCGIVSKLHNLNLAMKNLDKCKLRDILQNNWPVVFKTPRSGKTKIKERDRTRKHRIGSWIISWHREKEICGQINIWWNPNEVCRLVIVLYWY